MSLRSEEMIHKGIRIPRENADEIMRALGNIENSIEFVDLTKDEIDSRKPYFLMIKRCDEMTQKLSNLERVCSEFTLPVGKIHNYTDYFSQIKMDIKNRDKILGSTYFDLIEAEVIEDDRKIKDLLDLHSQVREDLVNLIEKKHVFKKCAELTAVDRQGIFSTDLAEVEANEEGVKQSNSNLNFMSCVVSSVDANKMKKMIFRVSRGRAFSTYYDLVIDKEEYLFTSTIKQRGFSFAERDRFGQFQNVQDLINIKPLNPGYSNSQKKIFTIIFQGGPENVLLGKILRVCECFQCSRYAVPKISEINNEIHILEREISDKKHLLIRTEQTIQDYLMKQIAKGPIKNSKYVLYKLFFSQERLIYTTLNKCYVREMFLDGEVWIPKKKLDMVMSALQSISLDNENKMTASLQEMDDVGKNVVPPTFIETNDFVWAFQLIVNTFGVPRYREINPAYFTIITFPFLFGIMFGDVGHGLIVFIFGLYFCWNKEKILEGENKIMRYGVKARFILLLMGFFACYCGFIYNDFFSIPLEFGSCYTKGTTTYTKNDGCTHKFGLDAKWHLAQNELTFTNSMKMKLSVIFGVVHMVLGIVLKGVNCISNRETAEFVFIFIPQLVFMVIIFGYMDLLIVLKWNIKWEQFKTEEEKNLNKPLDIKTLLLNLFLKTFKNLNKEYENYLPIWGNFDKMRNFHIAVFFIAIACALIMLLPKTWIDYRKAKNRVLLKNNDVRREIDEEGQEILILNEDNYMNNEGEPKFSDYFVNSIIVSIEFVLGSVSNTASYLRLWALSLAHTELSEVFFKYCITNRAIGTDYFVVNLIVMVIVFIIFGYITMAVLLFMDLMECFLHTLRLHWVEFQDKFYKADGYAFTPFCFRQALIVDD